MGLSFLQVATAQTTNAATYTFTAQNFGTAAPDRYILCAVHSSSTGTTARSISSLTIGGVNATKVVEITGSATNLTLSAFWIAAVPTGASGNVVVNFNTTMQRCQIALHSLIGMNPAAFHTLQVTTNNQNNGLNCPDRSVIVAACTVNANTTCTFNLNEVYDATMEANATTYAGVNHGTFSPVQQVNTNANFVTGTEFSGVWASFGEVQGGGLPLMGVGA